MDEVLSNFHCRANAADDEFESSEDQRLNQTPQQNGRHGQNRLNPAKSKGLIVDQSSWLLTGHSAQPVA